MNIEPVEPTLVEETTKAVPVVPEVHLSRKQRRVGEKLKRQAKHVTNSKSPRVKVALGSKIMACLGQVQMETTKTMLDVMPLGEFMETVNETPLSTKDKALLNAYQQQKLTAQKAE